MKKNLFLISVVALALGACSNDTTLEQNTATELQPKEIAFSPLSQTTTRTSTTNHLAIEGTTFPTTIDMMVSAYDVTHTRDFFGATNFKYKYANSSSGASHSYWGGETAKYWPLSATYVNFLAIANANDDNATSVTWGNSGTDTYASKVVVAMADNYAYNTKQHDFLYAIGHGQVTQTGNALSFDNNGVVDMTFKHAQAYLTFNLKAADAAATAIKIKDIQIYGARFAGTATVTHTNYNATSSQATTLYWNPTTQTDAYKSVLADQTAKADAASSTALTTSFVELGKIMVVPNMSAIDTYSDNGTTKIKITYYLDGNDYTYECELDNDTYEAGKKYIYNITFTLHEIFINPEVEDWTDGGTNYVDIPTFAAGTAGRTFEIPATAGKYTFRVAGFTGASTPVATGTLTSTITSATVSVTDYTSGVATVTFTVPANAGSTTGGTIILTDTGVGSNASNNTTVTISQASGS